ncbi:MAG: hypothetical protein KBI32_14935, partial [Phycisphaerae bacterium]|nr:hypothetical protein [Phycisphaerae bacterium]
IVVEVFVFEFILIFFFVVEVFIFIVIEVLVIFALIVEVFVLFFFIVEFFIKRLARAVGGFFTTNGADAVLYRSAARATGGAST